MNRRPGALALAALAASWVAFCAWAAVLELAATLFGRWYRRSRPPVYIHPADLL